MKLKKISFLLAAVVLVACSSDDNYTPKPRGYFRINVPTKEYTQLATDCPFTFEYNKHAQYQPKSEGYCWADIYYPTLKARIQLTYKKVTKDNLDQLLADGHNLAFKHEVVADGIREKLFTDQQRKVYGLLYKIQGAAATNAQFFMTDSTENFLRGVLYFYSEPNEDSLKPVNDYMYNEIVHLIETLKWQNSSR